jgi:Cu-Zn family superoxide dismutase
VEEEGMHRGIPIAALALCVAACTTGNGPTSASATFEPKSGTQVTGTVTFADRTDGTKVVIEVRALPPGKHGVYVHENGDCTGSNAAAVGKRFRPGGDEQASFLGEIEAGPDGSGDLALTSKALAVAAGER